MHVRLMSLLDDNPSVEVLTVILCTVDGRVRLIFREH